jgi:hypothetical protein
MCNQRARATTYVRCQFTRALKDGYFAMFRSLFLAALLAASILSAAPTPQSFRQPLIFEPNRGQTQPQATWTAHGPGYQLQLTDDALVVLFREPSVSTPRTLKMKLTGSRPWSHVVGLDATGGISNYLNRPNGAAPLTEIPQYARVQVSDVYQGVDMVLYSDGGNLEYDFVLQPDADPKQIQLAFEGQRGLRVDTSSGDLVLTTPTGSELRQMRPKVYQQASDRRVEVNGGYRLLDVNRAAFTLATYDPQRPLVIDPTVQLVQMLGGNSEGRAVALDSAGNSYVTGSTDTGFPVTNSTHFDDGQNHSTWSALWSGLWAVLTFNTSFQALPAVNEVDAFVTKLNPQGAILFSTYYGIGAGLGIAVDSTGVVITGWRTDSASDSIKLGSGLFVGKLSLTGSPIYYQLLQGADSDSGTSVALDSQHNAWVSGVTSTDASGLHKQDVPDALALELSPQGAFLYRKTFGGSGPDVASGVAVDGDDNPWFTGQTCSNDFPASPGFNNLRGGKCGIFVIKLVHQSGSLNTQFVTVFGGSDSDAGRSIAVNANREAYVTGNTSSLVFYTSQGAYQVYPTGSFVQGFVTQIDGFGHYIHSTLLGTSGDTSFQSIALNAEGEVYVAGLTTAATFPQNGPLVPNPTAGIIAKLSPDLSTLYYSRQQGTQLDSVALRETVPSVTPAQIFTSGEAGYQNVTRAFVDELVDDSEYTRLRNYWITDRDINNQSGATEAGQVAPGWWSAQWTFELQPAIYGDPANTPVFWIRNRWTGQYLNIQSGAVQTTAIGPGWLSARWTFELIGPNVYRIRNVWQPDQALNIQNGSLSASHVEPDWWSAWWIIDRVF